MESLWLHRNLHPDLIIFCNGWGMDERPFRPLGSERYDVLMLCDYRRMTSLPDALVLSKAYSKMYLVAWSMGVWMGQHLFSASAEFFQAKVAINGTLCPIHDHLGIPEAILLATTQNYSEDSRQKLYRRMCRDSSLCSAFQANLPGRSLASQKEELEVLITLCDCQSDRENIYSHIMIAEKDFIMPTANQLQFWQNMNPLRIQGQHFPFYLWPTWDALLAEALQAGKPVHRHINAPGPKRP